jgi:hypothetical protein
LIFRKVKVCGGGKPEGEKPLKQVRESTNSLHSKSNLGHMGKR